MEYRINYPHKINFALYLQHVIYIHMRVFFNYLSSHFYWCYLIFQMKCMSACLFSRMMSITSVRFVLREALDTGRWF